MTTSIIQDLHQRYYAKNRFNLLGSGWVNVGYDIQANGLESYVYVTPFKDIHFDQKGIWLHKILAKKHLAKSKDIWKQIQYINSSYSPIDWQKDFISGFRFSVKRPFYKQEELMKGPGIDLKIPWELSRLQHLPQIASLIHFEKVNEETKTSIFKTIQCHTLDFIMSNPKGMGVNWVCTMDVGIRAANLCMTYYLCKEAFDGFEKIFKEYIYDHAQHIIHNMEYKASGLNSNHYLGNIAGLAFIAALFPEFPESDYWAALSIQEIGNEIRNQFLPDGGVYEGSTSYHRLSLELCYYPIMVLLSMDEKRKQKILGISHPKHAFFKPYLKNTNRSTLFSKNVFDSLYKSLLFNEAVIKPSGNIMQVGDTDSGRLFRFSPIGEYLSTEKTIEKYAQLHYLSDTTENEPIWHENHINHNSHIAALSTLFATDSYKKLQNEYWIEHEIVNGFIQKPINVEAFPPNKYVLSAKTSNTLAYSNEEKFLIESLAKPVINIFPHFGLITCKTDSLTLLIRFHTEAITHPNMIHFHNDGLSFDLTINGKDILFDPGTYLYTPIPEIRNIFRSVRHHNTIYTGEEQHKFSKGKGDIFQMKKRNSTKIISLSTEKICLEQTYGNTIHERTFYINSKKLIIVDRCNKKFTNNWNNTLFSDGYGQLVRSNYLKST